MLKKRLLKKLVTIGLSGVLTTALSIAAFAQPGGGGRDPQNGGGGGPRNESSDNGPAQELNGGSAPSTDFGDQTFTYGDRNFSLETGEAIMLDSETDSDTDSTQTPPAPPSGMKSGMKKPAPPADGEEPPEKPEDGEEPPEKPEGDEAPEKPDGDEERPERPEGMDFEKNGKMQVMIDMDSLSEAVTDLEDEETASSLTELLDAYTAAMEEEREAVESEGTDEDTMASLREASDSARQALIEALEAAGLDPEDYSFTLEPEKPEDLPEGVEPPEKPEGSDEDAEETSTVSRNLAPAKAKTGKTGIVSRTVNAVQNLASSVGNWFTGIFNR